MGWLEGNVAIITGGGSGLGRALVDRFVERRSCSSSPLTWGTAS
jgi:NAD(P)-dependent dehydrogenase (short-subunit alcohol dehydrogenase family)